MYVKKQIVKEVIDLFTDKPEMRDDRWETMRIVTGILRRDNPELSEWGMIQLAFDVDRAFRYVQQHIPQLRGTNWMYRQMRSGEISKEDYETHMEHLDFIKEISIEKQLKLF